VSTISVAQLGAGERKFDAGSRCSFGQKRGNFVPPPGMVDGNSLAGPLKVSQGLLL
jgi:hypothetical protein